ncbi:MAG: TonB-dependent receptor, partial [Bacteroidota bacterium]|nr:TonB-dependent receptor [Bacteroidota bacterium]
HSFTLAKKINVDVGSDIQYFTGEVDGYSKKVNETRASGFLLFRYDPLAFLHLNLNLRQAWVIGFNPPLAPTLGFALDVLQKNKYTLTWKGAATRGYRVPTLNDRYWPTGNANLKPENSYNFETGFMHKYILNRLTLESEVTAYQMQVENWIQWLPATSTGIWSPQNLKEVHASGFELSSKAKWSLYQVKLTGGINYSYTSSRQAQTYSSVSEPIGKQLIYVPYHTATAFADITYKTWLITANYQFTGSRYTTAENTLSLPAYGLISLYSGKTIPIGKTSFQIIARVNNLTNQVYQNLEYYAMPGRNYQLSIRFTFH